MKKITLICIVLFASKVFIMAQNTPHVKEKVESYRVAFITDRLHLTPEEAQKFWPIFNEFKTKQQDFRRNLMRKNIEDMSDAEAEQHLNAVLEADQRELDLKKDYFQRLRSFLPARKLAMLARVERDFKEEILRRAKNRMRN